MSQSTLLGEIEEDNVSVASRGTSIRTGRSVNLDATSPVAANAPIAAESNEEAKLRKKQWKYSREQILGLTLFTLCVVSVAWHVYQQLNVDALRERVLDLEKKTSNREEQSKASTHVTTYILRSKSVQTIGDTPSFITTGFHGSLGPWKTDEGSTNSGDQFYGIGPFRVAGKKILGIRVPEAGVYDVRAMVLFYNNASVNICAFRVIHKAIIPEEAAYSMVAASSGGPFSPCTLSVPLHLDAGDIVDLFSRYMGRAVHQNFTTITIMKIS